MKQPISLFTAGHFPARLRHFPLPARHLLRLPRLKAILLFALIMIPVNSVPGQAPCVCDEAGVEGQQLAGCIRVAVRAARSMRGGLEWQLTEYPGEAAVRVTDPELRQRLLAQLRKLPQQRPVCGFGGSCRLDQILTVENEDRELNVVLPPALEIEPAREDLRFEGALCLFITPVAAPAGPLAFEVRIETASGRSGGETVELDEAGVAIRLRFTAQDMQNVRAAGVVDSDEAARSRVIDELREVVGRALGVARQVGVLGADGQLTLGCPDDSRTRELAREFEEALRRIYDLNRWHARIAWGRLDAGWRFLPGAGGCGAPETPNVAAWQLVLAGLQFVRRVQVRVAPDELDRQYTRTLTGRSLHRLRRQVEDELNARYGPRLAARAGHILTTDDLAADEALFCAGSCREIKSFIGPVSWPRLRNGESGDYVPAPNLRYEVLRRLPPERALALRVGAGFSPEERLTGKIGLSERQMLRLGEELSLDLAGGAGVGQIRVALNRPFSPPPAGRFGLRAIGIDWNHLRDRDQRYGNPSSTTIAVRETSSTARLAFGTAPSVDGARSGQSRISFGADVLLEYRDLRLDERSLLPSSRDRSQVANLALDLRAALDRDLAAGRRRGIGAYLLAVEGRLQQGLRLAGADYVYRKWQGEARGEILFGLRSPTDFLARHSEGFGRTGAGTPLFELFRPGGSRILRGVEAGELIGRRLRYRQTELGAALSLLVRRPAASSLYLKGFLDQARIEWPEAIHSGLPLASPARGQGIALEIRGLPAGEAGRQLNLSIGYGYSAQSRLHRSGTLVTTLMLNF